MIAAELIRDTLCHVLGESFSSIVEKSPTANFFARDHAAIPERVLVRHVLEHVFRIRMFRPLDAFAAAKLRRTTPRIGEMWAAYARSEAVHDRYFLRDLQAMGVTRDMVDAASPFTATLQLVRFVESSGNDYGPLPVVLYSFLAEQSSEVGTPPVISRGFELFGKDAVRGASAHKNLDSNLDHVGVISDILAAILSDANELIEAMQLLEVIAGLIGQYFGQLDAWGRRVSTGSRGRIAPSFAPLWSQT